MLWRSQSTRLIIITCWQTIAQSKNHGNSIYFRHGTSLLRSYTTNAAATQHNESASAALMYYMHPRVYKEFPHCRPASVAKLCRQSKVNNDIRLPAASCSKPKNLAIKYLLQNDVECKCLTAQWIYLLCSSTSRLGSSPIRPGGAFSKIEETSLSRG